MGYVSDNLAFDRLFQFPINSKVKGTERKEKHPPIPMPFLRSTSVLAVLLLLGLPPPSPATAAAAAATSGKTLGKIEMCEIIEHTPFWRAVFLKVPFKLLAATATATTLSRRSR